jgi:hypothetical protein
VILWWNQDKEKICTFVKTGRMTFVRMEIDDFNNLGKDSVIILVREK